MARSAVQLIFLQIPLVVDALAVSRALADAESSLIEGMILSALKANKDTAINPEINSVVPNPLELDVDLRGSSDAGCIIPNPFGGCICDASAQYSLDLNQLAGANGIQIASFDTVAAKMDSLTSYTLSVGATVKSTKSLGLSGGAAASCEACGISPSAAGTSATNADISGSVTLEMTGSMDSENSCIKLESKSVAIQLQNLGIHDSSVKISLGPIPGVDVGGLVDLILNGAPAIRDAISHAAVGPIQDALHGAINEQLPCIPLNP